MVSNSKYTKKFIKIFSITLFICLLIVTLGFFIYNNIFAKPLYDPSKQKDSTLLTEKEIQADNDSKSSGFLTAPVRTNFLIVGVDKEESLTDVMMVGSFISTTGEINLLSLPRDTYMPFAGDELNELRSLNKGAPSVMKLNSVFSYTQKNANVDFLKKTVENLLGINIEYYVKVDLDAFKSIVDAVGGIYFTVPEGGLKYSDPTQDLYINLKEGYQLLDGEAAEGLVRFRKGYIRQDLQRVEVQQEFVKEFIKQVLTKETIMKNFGEIALNLIKYVETDFGVSDFPKYLTSIQNIDTNNINSATAPGAPQYIGEVSYYLLNTTELKSIVDDFFYGNTSLENTSTDTSLNDENNSETIITD